MKQDVLPAEVSWSPSLALHVESVCSSFEAAWTHGRRPRLEEYLMDTPEPERSVLLRELLALDLEYRRGRGEQPTPEEYQRQLPADAALIQECFCETPPRPPADTSPGVPTTFAPPASPDADIGQAPTSDAPHSTGHDRLAKGDQVGGYRIGQVLGAGGMGMVFQAEDLALRRPVALKVIKPGMATPALRQRFLREARAAAALEHDHIVPIYQVGEDQGIPFLAMPLLKGESLAARLKHQPRLPLADVLRIGRETAEGLAAAHGHGLVHRDIKPANLWLETSDESGGIKVEQRPAAAEPSRPSLASFKRVKILDFGLVRTAAVAPGEPVTEPGLVIGTPAYMSPEQARGGAVDARSDLFSLGCVLYQMSTGTLPFQGTDMLAVLHALAVDEPRPPRALNPDLPAELDALILRLLAKKPEQRPATAAAVSRLLGALLEQANTTAPPQPQQGSQTPDVDATLTPSPLPAADGPASCGTRSDASPRPRTGRRGVRAGWIAVGMAVLMAVGAYCLVQQPNRDQALPPLQGVPEQPDRSQALPPLKPVPKQPDQGQALLPLKGVLDVVVARGLEGQRRYLSLSDPKVLPLNPGLDYVRIEARVNRAAYLYVVWVDTEGKASLIYPWDEASQRRPPQERPLQELFWPSTLTAAKLGGGPAGTESLLLLARDEKLPPEVDVARLFGGLPPQKSRHRREAAWFENGLLVAADKSRVAINFDAERTRPLFTQQIRIDDPVLQTQALLRTRLTEWFPYSRAVCFSNAGDR